jgi:hypothetical protein
VNTATSAAQAGRLRQGQGVPLPEGLPAGAAEVAVFTGEGALLGLGRVDPRKGLLLPAKMLML